MTFTLMLFVAFQALVKIFKTDDRSERPFTLLAATLTVIIILALDEVWDLIHGEASVFQKPFLLMVLILLATAIGFWLVLASIELYRRRGSITPPDHSLPDTNLNFLGVTRLVNSKATIETPKIAHDEHQAPPEPAINAKLAEFLMSFVADDACTIKYIKALRLTPAEESRFLFGVPLLGTLIFLHRVGCFNARLQPPYNNPNDFTLAEILVVEGQPLFAPNTFFSVIQRLRPDYNSLIKVGDLVIYGYEESYLAQATPKQPGVELDWQKPLNEYGAVRGAPFQTISPPNTGTQQRLTSISMSLRDLTSLMFYCRLNHFVANVNNAHNITDTEEELHNVTVILIAKAFLKRITSSHTVFLDSRPQPNDLLGVAALTTMIAFVRNYYAVVSGVLGGFEVKSETGIVTG